MGKIHLILSAIAMMLFASCSDYYSPPASISNEELRFNNHRTVQDAILIANHLRKNNASRTWCPISGKDVTVICSESKSRSSSNDTLLYIVNHGNNEGFTIVSAPYNIEPVLAITEEGDYGSYETESNESFQYILNSAKRIVTSIDTARLPLLKVELELPDPDTVFYQTVQTKRINIELNQYWPENLYCPNQIAGCGPIAIAQICSYFEQPSSLALNFPERDKSSITLDWSDLKSHYRSSPYTTPSELDILDHHLLNQCSTTTDQNWGRLVRQIGKDCNASYGKSGTSVSWTAAKNILNLYVSGNSFVESSDFYRLYNFLAGDSGVAMIAGGSHIWVADGTLYFGYSVTEYFYSDEIGSLGTVYSITSEHPSMFVHMNLGWGGNCNGYYASTIFDNNAYKYDHPYEDNSSENSYTSNFKYMLVR